MRRSTAHVVAVIAGLGLMPGLGGGISAGTAATASIAGKWLGIIKVPGADLRIAFEISEANEGGYAAVAHSIDQGAMNIPITTVTLNGDSVRLELKSAFAYEGKLQPDGNTIEGNWIQGGSTPLLMKRVDKIPELPRPQTPKKPYPYREEEIIYENPSAQVRIGATLTIPNGKGPFPAVLLIAGSGPQNRDEAVLGHKPFLVLADHLTRQGIAVLRADKRGVGKTTGTFNDNGLKDYVSDALAGVAYLKGRAEIDAGKIGLLGHSQGGSVAPMAAAQSRDVSYLVLLAAPGLSGYDILVLQDGTEAKAGGASDEQVQLIRGFSWRFYGIVLQAKDAAEIERETKTLYATLTDAEKKALDWPNLHGTLSLAWALTPGARDTLTSDVGPVLRQVRCPVLALNGGKDCQVPPRENLGRIERELQAGGNKDYTLRELPGLNHLFQTCRTGAGSEYIKIEETMSPLALQTISEWILAKTHPGRTSAP